MQKLFTEKGWGDAPKAENAINFFVPSEPLATPFVTMPALF